MTELTLDGKFYRGGIAGDPIVLISTLDEGSLYEWKEAHDVFTQIFKHRDPESGNDRPVIYLSETDAANLTDGNPVRLTIDTRPEKRGVGIRVVDVTAT